jgi:hypothetical protein
MISASFQRRGFSAVSMGIAVATLIGGSKWLELED